MAKEIGLADLSTKVAQEKSRLINEIEALVRIESPSSSAPAVNAAVDLVESWCKALGGRVKRHKSNPKEERPYRETYRDPILETFGDLLEVGFGARLRSPAKPILVLGHLDTVWDLGTLATMPCVERDGRLFGPGVYDMKAGVAMALTALRVLHENHWLRQPVTLLLVSDEEVGSPVSRSVTEKLALASSAVYVLEPGQGPQGAYKTARKGIGDYRLSVRGVAAHSGVDFEAGHSAVVELARQIERIAGFTELDRGLTVNPGVIAGGTRTNVVAAEAWVDIDVRIRKAGDAARIEKKLRSLRPVDRGCLLRLTGGINRPPMERTKGTVALYHRAATLARRLGFDLQEAATGGASDGNFTSALGLPTLDGMGAVGQGAHAVDESIALDALVPRTALLAAMLAG